MEEMPRGLLRWAGWASLVAFLVCMFLRSFCLFTLALILVVTVLGVIQVAMGYRPDRLDPLVTVLAFLTTVGGLGAMCVNSYLGLRSILGAFWRLLTASEAVRRASRSAALAVGRVLVAVLALVLFVFACLGAAFVLITGVGLAVVLTGHGPEQAAEAVAFVLGFPMAVLAFASLSLPSFAFVIATVRALRGKTS